MLSSQLADLDELVLTVRDSRSRAYIAEAVAAYRAGARRTALIATWIAVAFDVIAKLRELGASGDRAASEFIAELDSAIASRDARRIQRLQAIENALLETARDQFALLTPHEADALDRLKNDRNLCAHPAFVEEDQLFEPSPEAVRMHIVHAVTFLLQHHPVQGRHAIDHIIEELGRLSFPSAAEDATRYLDARYLARAKDSLIVNLTKRLLLALLRRDVPGLAGREQAVEHALTAVDRRHADRYRETVRGALDRIVGSLDDPQLKNVCRLIGADPRTWGWLSEPLRLRVRQFVATYQFAADGHADVVRATAVEELRVPLVEAFERLDDVRKVAVIAASPIPAFAPTALRLFGEAGGWRHAESLGEQLMVPLAPVLTDDQVDELLRSAESNPQIWDASRMPRILAAVLAAAAPPTGPVAVAWRRFMVAMTERATRFNGYHDPYEVLREALASRGIDVPAPQPPADEAEGEG